MLGGELMALKSYWVFIYLTNSSASQPRVHRHYAKPPIHPAQEKDHDLKVILPDQKATDCPVPATRETVFSLFTLSSASEGFCKRPLRVALVLERAGIPSGPIWICPCLLVKNTTTVLPILSEACSLAPAFSITPQHINKGACTLTLRIKIIERRTSASWFSPLFWALHSSLQVTRQRVICQDKVCHWYGFWYSELHQFMKPQVSLSSPL